MSWKWWRHPLPAAAVAVSGFFCWWSGRMPGVGNAEQPPTDEENELIEQAIDEAQRVVYKESLPDGLAKRDAHPHAHGCVIASFVVRSDIEPRFRQGVFAEPGHVYDAWVRFSNGTRSDDMKPDGRGMAIKLMGVDGEEERTELTQDFLMINNPTFFAADVKEYLDFFRRQSAGDEFGYFIGLNPFRWHLIELTTGLQLLLKKPLRSPLDGEYFSMLPFELGPGQRIKFSARPCEPTTDSGCASRETLVRGHGQRQQPAVRRGPHYLRDALVHDLAFDEANGADGKRPPAARFSFRVQLQRDGFAMPIEDASVTWSEAASPYVPVADVIIPYQAFDSAAQNEFCEKLSFNPWHSLPAHKPIGGLNRARLKVYQAISRYRHEQNGVERHEPRGFCLALDGNKCPANVQTGVRP